MAILNTEIDYDKVITDLEKCCLKEENCGTCNKAECIVGYAQNSILKCFKESITYVENGEEAIPTTDFKIYKEEEFESGIAHLLRQCRSCQTNHYNKCVISVIRNCYEIGLFGEAQPYEGSNFRYLNQINTSHPDVAARIIEEFHKTELNH